VNFLKKLFGGNSSGDKRSHYVYVRPKRCDQLVEVRIDLYNDLSMDDEGDGYFVRKVAQATRCPFPAEIHMRFDKGKRLVSTEIIDGEEVEKAEYDAWIAEDTTS